MTEPLLIQKQRALLRELSGLLGEDGKQSAELEANLQARTQAIEKEYQDGKKALAARHEADKTAAERELAEKKQAVTAQCEAELAAATKEFSHRRHDVEDRFETGSALAEKEYQEARWTITTVLDSKDKDAKKPVDQAQQHVNIALQKMQASEDEMARLVRDRRQSGVLGKALATGKGDRHSPDPIKSLEVCLHEAGLILDDLKRLFWPKLFRGPRLVVAFLVLWALLAGALYGIDAAGLFDLKVHWLAASAAAAVLLGLAACGILYIIARYQVADVYRQHCMALSDGRASCQAHLHAVTKKYQEEIARVAEAKKKGEADLRELEARHRRKMAEINQRHERESREVQDKYPKLLASLPQRRDLDLNILGEKCRQRLADLKQQLDQNLRQGEETYRKKKQELQARYQQTRTALVTRRQQGIARAQAAVAQINQESGRRFPAWGNPDWKDWKPAADLTSVVRFGEFQVDESVLVNGSGEPGASATGAPIAFSLPAFLAFPQRSSVLLQARDEGREKAIQALQALMLRLLTALPPGKARFTIIDPVGLGENFAAFMHLADHDEALVGARIWTEPEHIDRQLTDVSAHMETVIQKYLRNQYKSIDEYNAQAGEVAEPYRFLVVANFPANFTPEAARRLVSIAASGAACGVYVLASVDTRQPLPHGFRLADLEQPAVNLAWKDGRFQWKDEDFGKFPLRVDGPPDAGFFNKVLAVVGAKAKEASRVEVPFDFILPPASDWWKSDSRSGLGVPIGRAGATKRQLLGLGLGTSQHALIAGKTGSGKSTLLHVLITNLAVHYSPDEVELYLIDFKKGVEFKTYASHKLPHARVIAIESEREFGLSVLQKLDAELKRRGELFRDKNVQNLADFRNADDKRCQEPFSTPSQGQDAAGKAKKVPDTFYPMPRIMLIVDEFQEFFTEDDKIAQEAALLLDRLVRQGRAFGLHVLLGSQTLGGAYTLARSTIDQMAVRIALQCSEADAYLILSKDNPAARLLARPGEAIYNDANGLLEGNDLFQIVWLPEPRRDELLSRVAGMAAEKKIALPQIVFEGNAPAEIGRNRPLTRLLTAPAWPDNLRAATAWLGEAIAIKDPTSATFRRQSGSNLLLLGPNEEAARNILATTLLSLCAQHGPAAAQWHIFDGSPVDLPHAGFLGRLAEGLPQAVKNVAWADRAAVLAEIAAEVERRHQAHDDASPPIYLFVYALQRFRELRRQDDDFFRKDDKPAPPKLLETILTEGPAVGVHLLVWCDTLVNLQRAVDRQGMRNFDLRVLFQMSGNDSSTLIDTPAASKLGMYRALFITEELGQPEKFRPYGWPPEAWLQAVKKRLGNRTVSV